MNGNKDSQGVVTVEATISLTAFMFAIITLLTVVNICTAQAKISIAINTTADELSQYSYFYSLTGLNESQKQVYENGQAQTADINTILTNVNTVFDNAQNLGKTADQFAQDLKDENQDDITSITNGWDEAVDSINNIKDSGSSIKTSIENIAKNPKDVMFGLAKLAASKDFDLAKSRLIAAPLSKQMCKNHLVDTKNGDCEAYLKHLGVVPGASGKYIDGLDFSNSSLFSNGSDEIVINVRYKIKVLALLPINVTYTFNQTAITHGWLCGEDSTGHAEEIAQKSSITGETLWNSATVSERTEFIRYQGIQYYCQNGYSKTSGFTDVQMYNESKNDFAMIASYNPLYSESGERQKTLNDISENAVKERISYLAASIDSTTNNLSSVTVKSTKDGQTQKQTLVLKNKPTKTVYLVVPEDKGLKEKIEEIVKKCNTNGVNIVVTAKYGSGVSKQ